MPHQVRQSPSCWGCRARRIDRLTVDLVELSTQLSFTRPGQLSRDCPAPVRPAQAHNADSWRRGGRCSGRGRGAAAGECRDGGWVGAAAAGAPLGLGAALTGGLNVTPVVLLCLGAAVLALDWIPRTVLAVGVLPVVAVALMIIGIVGYTRRDLAV